MWCGLGYGTFKSFSSIFNMPPRLRLADPKQWFPNFGMHQRFVKTQISFLSLFFYIFWLHHTACGILVVQPGIEPTLPRWQHGVLTTGPLRKCPKHRFLGPTPGILKSGGVNEVGSFVRLIICQMMLILLGLPHSSAV